MPSSAESPAPESDLEADINDAIALCGGDLRATIRALVIANKFLEAERERLNSLVSSGFARGKLSLRDLP